MYKKVTLCQARVALCVCYWVKRKCTDTGSVLISLERHLLLLWYCQQRGGTGREMAGEPFCWFCTPKASPLLSGELLVFRVGLRSWIALDRLQKRTEQSLTYRVSVLPSLVPDLLPQTNRSWDVHAFYFYLLGSQGGARKIVFCCPFETCFCIVVSLSVCGAALQSKNATLTPTALDRKVVDIILLRGGAGEWPASPLLSPGWSWRGLK